jgi:hypothetical protein
VLLAAFVALPARGYAQAIPHAPAAQAPEPTDAQKDEARTRFQRALEFADDGNFDAALLELRRAYELAPSYKLLYNVGIIYQQLKDHARALDAFERYLAEGGADVPAERALDLKARMDRLRTRVALVDVRTSEPGAEVSVDDLPVGTTPFANPLRVNSGRRKITISKSGSATTSRIVELAGGETKTISVDISLPVAPPAPEPKSVVPWISWGTTLALAGAATATGFVALGAASDYDNKEGKLGLDPNELESSRSKAQTFALATDILAGAAIIAAGISIYFTVKPPGARRNTPSGAAGPTANGLRFTF